MTTHKTDPRLQLGNPRGLDVRAVANGGATSLIFTRASVEATGSPWSTNYPSLLPFSLRLPLPPQDRPRLEMLFQGGLLQRGNGIVSLVVLCNGVPHLCLPARDAEISPGPSETPQLFALTVTLTPSTDTGAQLVVLLMATAPNEGDRAVCTLDALDVEYQELPR